MRRLVRQLRSALAIALLAATPAIHADTDGAGYVGYWKLENNAQDSSSAGHNGQARRVQYADGRIGRGATLSGNGRIKVPYDASMDLSNGFSISLWFKLPQYGQKATLVGRGDVERQSGAWRVGLEGGWLELEFAGGDGQIQALRIPEYTIPLETWVYLNGWVSLPFDEVGLVLNSTHVLSSQVEEGLELDSIRQSTADLLIGDGFVGSIDEVEVMGPWE